MKNAAGQNCESLPVYSRSLIQGAGFVLGLNPADDCKIVAFSENLSQHLSLSEEQALKALQSPSPWLSEIKADLEEIQRSKSKYFFDLNVNEKGFDCYASIPANDPYLWLEFLPCVATQNAKNTVANQTGALLELTLCEEIPHLLNLACKHFAEIMNFPKVMVYRFVEDFHGEVISEIDTNPNWPKYIGQRFPNTDVPKNIRDGYLVHGGRFVLQRTGTDAALVFPKIEAPENYAHLKLRAVHPCHQQYMEAMGVDKSCSFPLIVHDELWGLLASHGTETDALSLRTLCQMEGYARLVSTCIERITKENRKFILENSEIAKISTEPSNIDNLPLTERVGSSVQKILNDFKATSLLVHENEVTTGFGAIQHQKALGDKLFQRISELSIDRIYSNRLGMQEYFPICGWLKIDIGSKNERNCIVLLRNEEQAKINWAGQPELRPVNNLRNPKYSFELWKELRKGHSKPWSGEDLYLARCLKNRLDQFVKAQHEKERTFLKGNQEASSAFLHDLSNSMQALTGYLDVILMGFEDDKTEKCVKALEFGQKRLLQYFHSNETTESNEPEYQELTKKLAELSKILREKIGALEVEFSNLSEMALVCSKLISLHREMHQFKEKNFHKIPIEKIANYLKLLEKMYQKHGDFQIHISVQDNVESIYFDESKLYRILTNLIKNALESVKKAQRNPEINCEIGKDKNGLGVEVRIVDNGIAETHSSAHFI